MNRIFRIILSILLSCPTLALRLYAKKELTFADDVSICSYSCRRAGGCVLAHSFVTSRGFFRQGSATVL